MENLPSIEEREFEARHETMQRGTAILAIMAVLAAFLVSKCSVENNQMDAGVPINPHNPPHTAPAYQNWNSWELFEASVTNPDT